MSAIPPQSQFKVGQSQLEQSHLPHPTPQHFERLTNRESADNYRRVLARFGPRLRVIICHDLIQWIMQQQDKAGDRWRAIGYFQTRQALQRKLEALGYPLPDGWPDHIRMEVRYV